jgi:anaerobic selenocysteine-containing dehydrogenase
MGITRRSLLQLMFGAAAGTAVTPLPWKLVDDASIWTQNWFLTPKLIRGETSYKHTVCGLCGGGCGVRVRMLGDVPIAVADQENHPVSRGGVCPLGLAAMQMRFHPCRIVKPVVRGEDGKFGATTPRQALSIVAERIAKAKASPASGAVAILDLRPRSAMSGLYLDFLDALGSGHYLTPFDDGSAGQAFRGMVENPASRIGYDFENAKTVVSFGAPLFEGWGGSGRMAGVKRIWNSLKPENRPRLIHAEPNHSVTASMADKWLAVEPGTEGALALGIGHVMLKEKLIDAAAIAERAPDFSRYQSLVEKFPVQKVSEFTGVKGDDIVSAARMLAKDTPSIAVAGCDAGAGPLGRAEEMAVAGLNLLIGSFGKSGGVVPLTELQTSARSAKTLDEVENRSIGLLIVDGSTPVSALPRQLVQKKLAQNSMTVSLFPYLAGDNLQADVVLPAASIGEWEYDVPTPLGVARNTYSIAAKMTDAPPGIIPPPELLALIAKAGGIELDNKRFSRAVEENLNAILASGRGTVFEPKTGKAQALGKFGSAQKLKKALVEGGCWVDDMPVLEGQEKFSLTGAAKDGVNSLESLGRGRVKDLSGDPGEYPLLLMPFGRTGESGQSALPQVMAKLYRETNLRSSAFCARINPETGARFNLANSCRAELKTPLGALTVNVAYDGSVRPGAVRVAVGPSAHALGDSDTDELKSILDVAEMRGDSCWRLTRASLKEVRHA